MCSAAAACLDTDQDQARALLTAAVIERLPAAVAEAEARLAPALGSDFKRSVAPTLALVAPAGMSREDQRAWLATAAETLSGMPADILEGACMEARRTVDHPSKIISAIFQAAGGRWDRRKADLALARRLTALAAQPVPEAPEYASPEEIAAIKAKVGLVTQPYPDRPAPKDRPAREPNAMDYVALCGMTPEAARMAVEEREYLREGARLAAAKAPEAPRSEAA